VFFGILLFVTNTHKTIVKKAENLKLTEKLENISIYENMKVLIQIKINIFFVFTNRVDKYLK